MKIIYPKTKSNELTYKELKDLKRSQSFNCVLSFYQSGAGGDFCKIINHQIN